MFRFILVQHASNFAYVGKWDKIGCKKNLKLLIRIIGIADQKLFDSLSKNNETADR